MSMRPGRSSTPGRHSFDLAEQRRGAVPRLGPEMAENVDSSTVQVGIIDYVTAYPKYVSEVYK